MLVHGIMDENVHFKHTLRLLNALVKAGRPYRLLLYPSEHHGIAGPAASEHYDSAIARFLKQHL